MGTAPPQRMPLESLSLHRLRENLSGSRDGNEIVVIESSEKI
jgi:hypothetical protein